MGFTGKNITTAIMDDGVDYMHPDIKNNFVSGLDFRKSDDSSNVILERGSFVRLLIEWSVPVSPLHWWLVQLARYSVCRWDCRRQGQRSLRSRSRLRWKGCRNPDARSALHDWSDRGQFHGTRAKQDPHLLSLLGTNRRRKNCWRTKKCYDESHR